MGRRLSSEQILALKRDASLAGLVAERVRLSPAGGELVGLCPFHEERTGSFYVNDDKGLYHCFGCGAQGDVIDYVKSAFRLSFVDAIQHLQNRSVADWGSPNGPTETDPSRRPKQAADTDTVDAARKLWAAAVPAEGTIVENYRRSRGLHRPAPSIIRFVRRAAYRIDGPDRQRPPLYLPAMIAAVQDASGDIVGVHRTFLLPDGSGKANVPSPRRMLGRCWRGAVRFTEATSTLVLGEGLETTESIIEAEVGASAWAALSLGNIAGAGSGQGRPHPDRPDRLLPSTIPKMDRPGIVLPATVTEVVILEDADSSDMPSVRALLERASRRFKAEGRHVRIASPGPGRDFNSLLMERPTITALAA